MSLVESTVALLVVSGLLLSALYTLNGSARAAHLNRRTSQGGQLAQQLMSEILGAAYEEPVDTVLFGTEGIEVPTSRTLWDDIDDYKTWTSSPPVDKDGVVIPGSEGWTRTSKVTFADLNTLASLGTSPDSGLKLITVTALAPTGETTTLQALRAVGGTTEHPAPVDTSLLIQAKVTIQTPGMTQPVSASTNLVNEVIDQ